MRRRELIALLGGVASSWPLSRLAALDYPPAARIGYLGIASGPLADLFLALMREGAYFEGQNLQVERREYQGNIPRLAEYAAELVRLKVDAIFATGPGPVRAVAKATRWRRVGRLAWPIREVTLPAYFKTCRNWWANGSNL
jgi:hypothetical protein